MKIHQKLLAGFIAIAFLCIASQGVTLYLLRRLSWDIENELPRELEGLKFTVQKHDEADKIRYYDEILTQSARNFVFTGDVKWKSRYEVVEPELYGCLKQARLTGDEEDREYIDNIDKANNDLVDMEYKAMKLAEEGRIEEAAEMLESDTYWDQKEKYEAAFNEYHDKAFDDSRKSVDRTTESISTVRGEEQRLLKTTILIILGVTLVLLAIVVAMGVFIARSIAKPILKLHEATLRLARGQVDTRVDLKRDDELGQLGKAFNQMADDLVASTVSRYELIKEVHKREAIEKNLKKSEEVLQEQADRLRTTLGEASKSRRRLVSMLEDNNEIREELEANYEKLKSTQSMLIQSEKLVSLGRLVSEMAHEVNNPLQAISGRAQLSEMDDATPEEIRENLKIIEEQCYRARDIIKRLLTFSRPSKGEPSEANVNEIVEYTIKLVEHQYSLQDIKIERNYSSEDLIVDVDVNQMQEVFFNIIKNAAEAMPEGGTITASTFREDGMVRLEFSDTGEGMPPAVMDNIFDPFFTTKKEGTGLGLSVCYGIVKEYKGVFYYESEPGKGTKAIIKLPELKESKGAQERYV